MKSIETHRHKKAIQKFEFRVSGFVKASCSYTLYQLGTFMEAYSFMLAPIVKSLRLKQEMLFPATLNIKENYQVNFNDSLGTTQKELLHTQGKIFITLSNAKPRTNKFIQIRRAGTGLVSQW